MRTKILLLAALVLAALCGCGEDAADPAYGDTIAEITLQSADATIAMYSQARYKAPPSYPSTDVFASTTTTNGFVRIEGSVVHTSPTLTSYNLLILYTNHIRSMGTNVLDLTGSVQMTGTKTDPEYSVTFKGTNSLLFNGQPFAFRFNINHALKTNPETWDYSWSGTYTLDDDSGSYSATSSIPALPAP